jgi:hypothetical protein
VTPDTSIIIFLFNYNVKIYGIHFVRNTNNIMSYAPVSTSETLRTTLNNNSHTSRQPSSTPYTHITAACRLSWTDDFYQGKYGIIAVLDRDILSAGRFQFWTFIRFAAIFVLFGLCNYLMGAWVKTQDAELAVLDDVQAVYFSGIALLFIGMAYRAFLQQQQQHIAVTTEGIRIDHGTTMTIIIPFDNIHQIQARKSFRYVCGLIEAPLSKVSVVRSLAPLEQVCFRKTRTLELYGIYQAQEFVDLVEAMKDSFEHGTYEGADMDTEMVASYRHQQSDLPQQEHNTET